MAYSGNKGLANGGVLSVFSRIRRSGRDVAFKIKQARLLAQNRMLNIKYNGKLIKDMLFFSRQLDKADRSQQRQINSSLQDHSQSP